MKRLLLILCLISGLCFADTNPYVLGIPITQGGGADPDWSAALDDNAASSTITADFGTDGRMWDGNGPTAINTSTVYNADGPSFHLNSTGTEDQEVIETSASMPDTAFEDNIFTIQFDMKSSASFTANFERLWAIVPAESQIRGNSNSDTSISIDIGGTNEGTFAVDSMVSGTWLTYRIVVDTGATNTISVYQGANEGSLTLKSSTTSSLTTIAVDNNFTFRLGGNSSALKTRNAQYRNWKIWYTAETP